MVNSFWRDRRLWLALAMLVATVSAAFAEDSGRWSAEKANEWYGRLPWLVGCNYIPSTAINQIETWQAESFDPKTIDRELGLAESIGFNTVRVFAHDLVWEADPTGFKKRLGEFLDICQKHHIRVIFTFFTNGCGVSMGEPRLGKQPDPTPGVHNSGWVQSPGAAKVNDPTQWGPLEAYVKDVIGTFAQDDRILMWCLYNEPENTQKGAKSLPLMRQVFAWARSVNPSQPLTAPIWILPGSKGGVLDIVCFLGENSDIMSFHCYRGPKDFEAFVNVLKVFDRPLICTEYMARPNNTFQDILPLLQRERIGAINFGLVKGKMNTHLPWSSKAGSPEPKVWFHDIFWPDGTPFDPRETALIKQLGGNEKGRE